jgi:hypothetical protein
MKSCRAAFLLRSRLHLLLCWVLLSLANLGCVVAQPAAEAQLAGDPPARVGRISLIQGEVVLSDPRLGSSEAALLNWPLTSGHRLQTGAGAQAEVRIGSLALRLDADTEVVFPRLDDQSVQIFVARGTVALRLRNPEWLHEVELLTPRERIGFDQLGQYHLTVERAPATTTFKVFSGAARVALGASAVAIAAGQRGDFVGQPLVSFGLSTVIREGFDDCALALDARDDVLRSAAYVAPETTGIEALDAHGQWRSVPEYGAVWFPSVVAVDWTPFRQGHWAYVPPWGWTWIDAAPWGFATGHYGRWVQVGPAWGWTPGRVVPRPVYAPAVVAWFGAAGGPDAAYGWAPLAPGEVYLPPYRHSPHYVQQINVQNVTVINHVTVFQPPPRYRHQRPDAAVWAQRAALEQRLRIERAAVPPPAPALWKPVVQPAVPLHGTRWVQNDLRVPPPRIGKLPRPNPDQDRTDSLPPPRQALPTPLPAPAVVPPPQPIVVPDPRPIPRIDPYPKLRPAWPTVEPAAPAPRIAPPPPPVRPGAPPAAAPAPARPPPAAAPAPAAPPATPLHVAPPRNQRLPEQLKREAQEAAEASADNRRADGSARKLRL